MMLTWIAGMVRSCRDGRGPGPYVNVNVNQEFLA